MTKAVNWLKSEQPADPDITSLISASDQISAQADRLARCQDLLAKCSRVCSSCADACLGEDTADVLADCIKISLICADLCRSTSRILARNSWHELASFKSQIRNCILACQICASECGRQIRKFEFCWNCVEVCRLCETACVELLKAIPVLETR